MFGRLAGFVMRRRRWVLVGAVVVFLVSGAIGGSVSKHLSVGGFEDPNAQSTIADHVLRDRFDGAQPNLVLLIKAKGGSVDAPDVATAGRDLTAKLAAEPTVSNAVSYWSLGSPPPLRSRDASQALVLARVKGDQDEMIKKVKLLTPRYTLDTQLMTVRVGGFAEVFHQVGNQIEKDLKIAEAIAGIVTMVLLVVIFGGVVAASLPLAIGVLSIVGAFLILRILASLTEVSIYSLNLTTAMGLALAIDYSLFMVSRYREELHHGREPDDALRVTMNTAGRTVAFGAMTVAASLAALLVFPLAFLRSFAYAGIAVVTFAALGALFVLPALLSVLGRRVDSLAIWKRHPRDVGEGFWHRMAMWVMRRPVQIATVIIVLLLVLGAPFLRSRFGLPDDRVLPKSASSRQVSEQIRTNFDSNETGAISMVTTKIGDPQQHKAEIDGYAKQLAAVNGVSRVDALTGSYQGGQLVFPASDASARFVRPDATFLSVVPAPDVEPLSPAGEQLVKTLRSVAAPFPVQSTGQGPQLVDSKHSLFDKLPLAGGIIAIVTFVMLFLMFGSVVVPIKAFVLNLLSLTATFGAMVWIFQEGHLSHLLNFTATGTIDTTTPILMFCIAFGLSMDYEVFLLSRIKEEHDRTGDNMTSVAVGLEHTGRLVTAAAALMAMVFIAFATSKITFIKLFGVGLAMAVLMDATLIRATLVPAFMRLAGEANWWAPAPLRRVYQRFGLHHEPASEPTVAHTVIDLRESYIDKLVRKASGATDKELRALLREEGLKKKEFDDLVGSRS
ncbi:MAG: MMPL family transporter [Actinobacteria bacterium]|nr:MMPL family transporter [Actinomycetota bacterium]